MAKPDNHDRLDWIKQLPGWITGPITFISTVVGFVKLWQGDTGLVTLVLLVVGVVGWGVGCGYLVFKRVPPLLPGGKGTWRYPRGRRWGLVGLVLLPVLLGSSGGYYVYQQRRPSDKVIILVANFDGPDPQKYRVTEMVLTKLRQAVQPNPDVAIQPLGRTILETDGSEAARAAGAQHKATIVIWGWYGETGETVPLSVHFEVLRPLKDFPKLQPVASGQVQQLAVAELKSVQLQTRLSAEMAYLSLFTVGLVHYTEEEWEEAIAQFSAALDQPEEPVFALDQSVVYLYRGTAYYATGEYDRAIADHTKAIELQPKLSAKLSASVPLSWPYTNRGLAYHAKGEYDRAIADYNTAIQLNRKDVLAYANRGAAYQHTGEYERAIADHTKAIELSPDFALAYTNRGNAYYATGEYDRAIADHTNAIELQPDYADAYINRGNAYLAKDAYDQAIVDYTNAIELQHDYADAYINRGHAYYNKGEHDQAIADYTNAIKLQPDYADAYINRGNAYYATGEYDRAIADHTNAIELQPDYALAYINRGNAYLEKGEYDQAIADYTNAIELQHDYADAYINRGHAYYNKGEHDQAIADYTNAIKLQPDYADAYYNRGNAYLEKGEYDQAIADYTNAIELQHDYADAYINRGHAYYNKGEYDRAIADHTNAIELQPDYALAYINRGLAYLEKGEYDQAMRDYTKATESAPADPQGWNGLCWTGSLWGQAANVLAACEQAVAVAAEDAKGLYRDSRGLARALTGHYTGAIEDFKAFVEWSKTNAGYESYARKREAWIAELEAGRNPFDAAMLEDLRNE